MTDWITSPSNERVKAWKKLATSKGRKKAQQYMLESWHLVQEAYQAGQILDCFLTQTYFDRYAGELEGLSLTLISDEVAKALSATQAPQGIFALVPLTYAKGDLVPGRYVLLDAVQDPGNVGTIIRTADAAGFDGVIVGDKTVDIFNDKTVRSMQGSQFHLKIYKMPLEVAIRQLQAQEVPVYATALDRSAVSLFSLPISPFVSIVVGNEGAGVSPEIIEASDQTVFIPMPGHAESLNVAIASALAIYHFIDK